MNAVELRAWVAARLDPLETYDPTRRVVRSDYDLNPGLTRRDDALTPAAVLIALVEHEDGVTVLLTRRADTLRSHRGQIAFPGGRCDPGETPWRTALREAQEEIGLDPAQVTLAGLSSAYQTGSGFDITPVVGFLKPGCALTPNPHEVADIFEAPFAFLMDPDNHSQRFFEVADGARRYFYAMDYQQRQIWGATAGMVRALYERLYGAMAA